MRALFVVALAVIGCGGPLEADTDDELGTREDELTSALRVRIAATLEKPRWTKRFEIDATNTLYFAADVDRGSGPHLVAFEVLDPSGNVWQRTEAACDGAGRVFSSMPVAGTWIQQYALTGQWKLKVFVDDEPEPSGRAGFSLR